MVKGFRRADQKATQGLRVRKARQASEKLKGTVAAQERCGLDAIQTQDERPSERQDHLRETVVVIAPGPRQTLCDEVTELQHSEKFMEEERAPIVRQTSMTKGYFDVLRRSLPCLVSSPKVSLPPQC